MKIYVELLVSHGFLPQTVLPSRITSSSATLIDHVFMYQQRPTDQILAGNLITDISDHFASILMLIQNVVNNPALPKVCFYSEKNCTKFKEMLLKLNWNELYEYQDANAASKIFNDKLSKYFNASFRLKLCPKNASKTNHGYLRALESAYARKTSSTFSSSKRSNLN